jgi:hypothetical protein
LAAPHGRTASHPIVPWPPRLRRRKKEAREVHRRSAFAQRAQGMRAKLFNQKRYKEKVAMKKTIAAHEEKEVRRRTLRVLRAASRHGLRASCDEVHRPRCVRGRLLQGGCSSPSRHTPLAMRTPYHVVPRPPPPQVEHGNAEDVPKGAVPAYLLDREGTTRAKVLSNTVKQKRKEKAGKWAVPLPRVKPVTDDEMFKR